MISIRSQPVSPEPHGNCIESWEHNYGPNPSLLHVNDSNTRRDYNYSSTKSLFPSNTQLWFLSSQLHFYNVFFIQAYLLRPGVIGKQVILSKLVSLIHDNVS